MTQANKNLDLPSDMLFQFLPQWGRSSACAAAKLLLIKMKCVPVLWTFLNDGFHWQSRHIEHWEVDQHASPGENLFQSISGAASVLVLFASWLSPPPQKKNLFLGATGYQVPFPLLSAGCIQNIKVQQTGKIFEPYLFCFRKKSSDRTFSIRLYLLPWVFCPVQQTKHQVVLLINNAFVTRRPLSCVTDPFLGSWNSSQCIPVVSSVSETCMKHGSKSVIKCKNNKMCFQTGASFVRKITSNDSLDDRKDCEWSLAGYPTFSASHISLRMHFDAHSVSLVTLSDLIIVRFIGGPLCR